MRRLACIGFVFLFGCAVEGQGLVATAPDTSHGRQIGVQPVLDSGVAADVLPTPDLLAAPDLTPQPDLRPADMGTQPDLQKVDLGVAGTGGAIGTGGQTSGTGGSTGAGGATVAPGIGGSTGTGGSPGTGGSTSTTTSAEPCAPNAPVFNVNDPSCSVGLGSSPVSQCVGGSYFKTPAAFCFKTSDDIVAWYCSNCGGRTIKVNGVAESRGATAKYPDDGPGAMPLPAKVNGYYYFDVSAGSSIYADIWWCATPGCAIS
jgi:hypothetical protein